MAIQKERKKERKKESKKEKKKERKKAGLYSMSAIFYVEYGRRLTSNTTLPEERKKERKRKHGPGRRYPRSHQH
jgi:hypothetical protein